MFMEKGTQQRFRFLPQGKKKSLVLRILCPLALCLVLSLTVLYSSQNNGQVSKAALASADVSVDFGSRQNKSYPIPSNLLGVGGIGIGYALNHDGSAVPQANFR